jgi:predicted nuclease with TOPRIM domain
MRKFEKKINELGLEKGKLSKNLNDVVRNFELAEDELKSLKLELRAAEKEEDNEDEIDNLLSKIEETESQLEQTDDYLVKKIEVHHKNGDMYAIRAEKMREARQAKAANKNSTPPQTQSKPIEEQKIEPIVTIKEEVKAQPEAQQATSVAKDNEVKEKKGTNWILWGILGVAGIFVGINLYKNKR